MVAFVSLPTFIRKLPPEPRSITPRSHSNFLSSAKDCGGKQTRSGTCGDEAGNGTFSSASSSHLQVCGNWPICALGGIFIPSVCVIDFEAFIASVERMRKLQEPKSSTEAKCLESMSR